MERDHNRNRNSFRSTPSDNRRDHQAGKGERQDRPVYAVKRERREHDGNRISDNRTDRNAGRNYGERREQSDNRERAPYRERADRPSFHREYRPSGGDFRREGTERRPERKVIVRKSVQGNEERRPRVFRKEENSYGNDNRGDRGTRSDYGERTYNRTSNYNRDRKNISGEAKEELRQKHYSKKKILAHRLKHVDEENELRLNRFISMGGICSRRDADELITSGRVKVNGQLSQTVGQKVRRTDKVEVDGKQVLPEKKVYILLNKPKDFVTTVEDPLDRKTVMSLIAGACKERVYPVGRLDRQTTGVLLFTNDGDLAKKLTHPKYDHKKIYHVFLDKPLVEEDLQAITNGVELEDGFIKADDISYASPDFTEVGVEIHSGKNRIVRRIFEHFGYQIVKLDRVYFAGITKKNVPRGQWRFLTPKEVSMLKVY
ncbi:MAG: pseudouridine synthase [Odoribacter sp.]